jgi:hypothetical protein
VEHVSTTESNIRRFCLTQAPGVGQGVGLDRQGVGEGWSFLARRAQDVFVDDESLPQLEVYKKIKSPKVY